MLADYVTQHPEQNGPVWIGLSDPSHQHFWKWTDRTPAKFYSWAPGQPDPPSKGEHCVALEKPGFNQWHDYPCNWKFPFICKQESRGRHFDASGETSAPSSELGPSGE
nr:C-type lectin mannose-binding isoform-like [Pelodiscus sinensis]|eukprot:XP_006128698.2 C-type lectin mannose-binding isoform-like [Pelodiscus sinensis]